MNNRRLLVVSSSYPPSMGGLERYVESSSKQLLEFNWAVTILACESDGLNGENLEGGVRVYRTPCLHPLGPRFPIPALWSSRYRAFIKSLDSNPPDVVLIHSHLFPLSLLGAILGKRWGSRVGMIGHGSNYVRPGGLLNVVMPIYEHAMMLLIRPFASKYFGVSTSADTWWKTFGVRGCGIIHNGIDVSSIPPRSRDFGTKLGIPSGDVIVSYAARLVPQKGADNFARLAMKLAHARPHVHFLVAGSGPLEKEITSIIGNTPNVRFLGKLDRQQMLSMLASTDVFAYPSTYPEGLPTSLLEAGASGCKIVSMDVGGARDLIPNSDFGVVTETISQFESAVISAIDASANTGAAENLRQRIEADFDWKSIGVKLNMHLNRMYSLR